MNSIITTITRQTRAPCSRILAPTSYTFSRTFASARDPKTEPKTDAKPAENTPKRQPPTVLGVKERPVPDRNSWVGRQKQKLQDLTNYEKAFASHAEERRYL
jgi:hypothetical protein